MPVVEWLESPDEKTDSQTPSFSRPVVSYIRNRRIAYPCTLSISGVDALEVDGSFGEGGGQILRTAVTFSVIAGRPVRVSKIRAGREIPGLRQQHVSTLQALGLIFGAELKGAEIGSSEITFSPGSRHLLSTSVDMKTAASITLLLQAVIPAVALTRSRVALQITGGTDVPWSPTLDYLSEVVRPAYKLMGLNFRVDSTRRGYYPRGGGKVSAEVEPASSLHPVSLTTPHTVAKVDLVSRCACLPRHVAERQLESMVRFLSSSGVSIGSRTLGEEKADSPGSSVLAYTTSEGHMIGADAIGARGRRAEDVGEQAAVKLASSLSSGAAVDTNLADMIAPLLSLADGASTLRVPQVSLHLKTGLHVARLFTGCEYSSQQDGATYVITIRPDQGHNA